MGNWWNVEHGGAPRWLFALGIVVLAGVGVLWAVVGNQTPTTASADAPFEPSTPDAPTQPIVSIVGDSWTEGTSQDSGVEYRWPQLLAANLPIDVTVSAAGGNGYNLADGSNFAKLATAVNPASSVVVLFGSLNDQDGYQATVDGARAALSTVADVAPDATVVVVGPAVPEIARAAPVPPLLLETRDALRDVAVETGVTFVDPIDLGWLAGRPDTIGADFIHPNDAGHQYLYDQMRAIIEPLL